MPSPWPGAVRTLALADADGPSIVPAAHRVAGGGTLAVHGAGSIRLVLEDGASVRVAITPAMSYTWSGQAGVRVPNAGERIFVVAEGVLEVRGEGLAVEVTRGSFDVELRGRFDVAFDPRAAFVGADGLRRGGQGLRRHVVVDGARVAEVQSSGAAA